MSTRIKDSLHELIGSLTKTEKRYYKLHATRHLASDDCNMVVLFDYISRQEVYDEEALIAHFHGKAFLNQFSTVKKRLYDQLLQSLHLFHANSSVEAQLGRMLHQATILYEKSLYTQSLRQLRSLEKIAEKHDLSLILIQSGKLRQRILETQGYEAEEKAITELHTDIQQLLAKEQLIHQLWNLKSRVFRHLQTSGIATSETGKEKPDQLIRQLPDIGLIEAAQSTEATYLYFHIQAAYQYALGDFHQSLVFCEQTIEHLRQHPSFASGRPNILLSVLTNACYLAETTGQFEKSEQFLRNLKTIEKEQQPLSEDLQIKLFSSITSIELSLVTLRGDFQAAGKLLAATESGLEKHGAKIPPLRMAFFHIKLAGIYTGTENYAGALKKINLILNDYSLDEKEELMTAAHLMNVILHYELRNISHLPFAIRNAQKLIKSRNRSNEHQAAFLQTLLKISKAHELDHAELFSVLFNQLEQIQNKGNTLPISVHFDFPSWIESRIRKISLGETIRQKYHFLASA